MQDWMNLLIEKLLSSFGERVLFVGLQGSRGRDEATMDSDIDPVVILDRVDMETLEKYRELLDEMPMRSLCCGFVAGLDEIRGWEKSDLFQLYYDVTPYYGHTDILSGGIEPADVRTAIRLGACNIYHICAHQFLHGRKINTIRGQMKAAAFVLQTLYFERTGQYVRKHRELLGVLPESDRRIMQMSLEAKAQSDAFQAEWEAWSMELWKWAGELIRQYANENSGG